MANFKGAKLVGASFFDADLTGLFLALSTLIQFQLLRNEFSRPKICSSSACRTRSWIIIQKKLSISVGANLIHSCINS